MRSFQTSVFLSRVDPPSLLPMTDGAAARVDDSPPFVVLAGRGLTTA